MKSRKSFLDYPVLALTCTLIASCTSSTADKEAPPVEQVTGSAPVIFGDPATSVQIGAEYRFVPEASDADGDILTFRIGNKPFWAEFDTTTGELRGMPQDDDVGEYPNIVISVADNSSVVSLPAFTVTVNTSPQGEDGDGAGSTAPTISGEPNKFAVAATTYAFQPAASDPEGDALSWSIVNKPAWATFDTTTGRLQGKPPSAEVGQSAPIELSVSDGTSIAALPAFTITVQSTGSETYTVSWIAPMENEDGSPLTDLAGYRIYYGMVPGDYTETVVLDSPGLTSYVLDDLVSGRYYLVMTAVNSQAMESRYTSELSLDTAG